MKIESLERKYSAIELDYQEALKNVADLREQLNNLLFLFDLPEKIDDESFEELCEILPDNYSNKLLSIKKYLKIINKFPNQSQIIEAKKILEEIKVKLIEIVDNECNNLLAQAGGNEIKYIEIYRNQIADFEKNNSIDISKVYELIHSLNKKELPIELVSFLLDILKNGIEVNNDLNNISFNYYLILDSFIDEIDNNLTGVINSDDYFVYKKLKEVFEDKLDDIDEIDKLKDIICRDYRSKRITKRVDFLLHIYKFYIKFEDEQIDFLNRIYLDYNQKINDSKTQNIINNNSDFLMDIDEDSEYYDSETLANLFIYNNIPIDKQLDVLCSVIAQNRVRRITKVKSK